MYILGGTRPMPPQRCFGAILPFWHFGGDKENILKLDYLLWCKAVLC